MVPLIDIWTDPSVVAAFDPNIFIQVNDALNNWKEVSGLYIVANSMNTACDISILGDHGGTDKQFISKDWKHADTLKEAVDIMMRLWDERDLWLEAFLDNE